MTTLWREGASEQRPSRCTSAGGTARAAASPKETGAPPRGAAESLRQKDRGGSHRPTGRPTPSESH
ncbi:hypothetical protein RZS08_02070, partial [Arthrospira platensis SPKY1]|nr:hypothetical protein [Arthrospira platensis SPKY1]